MDDSVCSSAVSLTRTEVAEPQETNQLDLGELSTFIMDFLCGTSKKGCATNWFHIQEHVVAHFTAGRELSSQERSSITQCMWVHREQAALTERQSEQLLYTETAKTGPDDSTDQFLVCTAYTQNYTIGTLCAAINQAYCKRHGYLWREEREHRFEDMMGQIAPRRNCSWYKILMLRKLLEEEADLLSSQRVRYLLWIDADAIVVDPSVTLSDLVAKGKHMELIIGEDMYPKSPCAFNAGIFLIKVGVWARQFLRDVWEGTAGTRYQSVAHFEQAAMIKQLKMDFEGLDDKYKQLQQPYHSLLGGPVVKSFIHVCVLGCQEMNTNITDEEGPQNREGAAKNTQRTDQHDAPDGLYGQEDGGQIGVNVREDEAGIGQEPYAKFAFHVAGRRQKVKLLLEMVQSRQIPIPACVKMEALFLNFNGRPGHRDRKRDKEKVAGTGR
eukprot:gene22545-27211_t